MAHLVKSEVPTKLELSSNPQPAEENFESPKVRVPRAISDPCQPNPCRNGGACVIHQGRAACRLEHIDLTIISACLYINRVFCLRIIKKKLLVFVWLIYGDSYISFAGVSLDRPLSTQETLVRNSTLMEEFWEFWSVVLQEP